MKLFSNVNHVTRSTSSLSEIRKLLQFFFAQIFLIFALVYNIRCARYCLYIVDCSYGLASSSYIQRESQVIVGARQANSNRIIWYFLNVIKLEMKEGFLAKMYIVLGEMNVTCDANPTSI